MLINAEDFKALLRLAYEVEQEPRKFSKAKRLAIETKELLLRAQNAGLIGK